MFWPSWVNSCNIWNWRFSYIPMSFSISSCSLSHLYSLCYLDSPISPLVDPVLVPLRNILCITSKFRILAEFFHLFLSYWLMTGLRWSYGIFFQKQNTFFHYFLKKRSEKYLRTPKLNIAKSSTSLQYLCIFCFKKLPSALTKFDSEK